MPKLGTISYDWIKYDCSIVTDQLPPDLSNSIIGISSYEYLSSYLKAGQVYNFQGFLSTEVILAEFTTGFMIFRIEKNNITHKICLSLFK